MKNSWRTFVRNTFKKKIRVTIQPNFPPFLGVVCYWLSQFFEASILWLKLALLAHPRSPPISSKIAMWILTCHLYISNRTKSMPPGLPAEADP